MDAFYLALYFIAGTLLLCATFNLKARVNLLALGLFVWILVPLIHAIKAYS